VGSIGFLVTIHDHPQRLVALKTKPPTFLVQLHAGWTEISQKTGHLPALGSKNPRQVAEGCPHQPDTGIACETRLLSRPMSSFIPVET